MCAPSLPFWSGLTNRNSSIWEAPQGPMEMAKAVWQKMSSPELQLQVGGQGQWGTGPQLEHLFLPALGSSSLRLPPVAFALLPGSELGISRLHPHPRAWVQIQFHLARYHGLWAWLLSSRTWPLSVNLAAWDLRGGWDTDTPVSTSPLLSVLPR